MQQKQGFFFEPPWDMEKETVPKIFFRGVYNGFKKATANKILFSNRESQLQFLDPKDFLQQYGESCSCNKPGPPITVNSFTFDAQQSGWITIDPNEEPSDLRIMLNPSNLSDCVISIRPLLETHKLYFPDGWHLESGWDDGGLELSNSYNGPAGPTVGSSRMMLQLQHYGGKVFIRSFGSIIINKSLINCVLTYNISSREITGVFDLQRENDKNFYVNFSIYDNPMGGGYGVGFEIPEGVTHYEGKAYYNYYSGSTPHINDVSISQNGNTFQYIMESYRIIVE